MALRSFPSIRRALVSYFRSRKEVLAVYVFGSVASGTARPASDVDIALLVSDRVMQSDALQYRLNAIANLMGILKREDVDLILLNQASPLLAHRVLSKGKLILERSPSARVAFQVRAVNRYLDTQPMRNIYLSYLKKQHRKDAAIG